MRVKEMITQVIHIIGGLLRAPLRFSRQDTNVINPMYAMEMITHNADRERDERELKGLSFAIYTSNCATFQIFLAIERHTFLSITSQDMATKSLLAFRRCHNHKI